MSRPLHTPRDSFGRQFRKLRVSLTDACNFACTYCVAEGERLRPTPALDGGELARCVRLIHAVTPLQSLRVTGGEPLIAPALHDFLVAVRGVGVPDLSLTTNGHLLREKLPLLVDSGMRRINVSLDSLQAERFHRITRGGCLHAVLEGIDAALEAGLRLKINVVPMRGVNDDEVPALVRFGLERGIEVRFIELMRMGHYQRGGEFETLVYPMADILATLAAEHELAADAVDPAATAQRWTLDGGAGRIGIIPNVSAPFCAGCDRLRLTAQGRLYGCISNARSQDMSSLLRMSDDMATARLTGLLEAALADKQPVRFSGMIASMRSLGG